MVAKSKLEPETLSTATHCYTGMLEAQIATAHKEKTPRIHSHKWFTDMVFLKSAGIVIACTGTAGTRAKRSLLKQSPNLARRCHFVVQVASGRKNAVPHNDTR
jgi:hypothetical protein